MAKETGLEDNAGDEALYGFGGRLSADFPSQILMDITEICNLACTHCPHPGFARSEHYAGRQLDPALNEKMVEEVRLHGQGRTQYIRYAANGEPLVHPNAYDMIEAAVKYSGVYVTLTTNGTIMNEKRTLRLLESGIHMIDISLDAYSPETYARLRVGGDLNITRSNVLRLIEWAKNSKAETRVVVSYVEQPLNCNETKDFESFWKDNGADYVVVRRLHSCSGAKEELRIQRRLANKNIKRRPCLYPWERLVINAGGEVAFCPSDWVHGSVIADYRTTTIQEIWQGNFYSKLRNAHISGNYTEYAFCGQCPDWEATRWPWEGRSYADMIEEFTHKNKPIKSK